MAVERIQQFTIDLSQIVNRGIESFGLFRKRFRAMREADFQRRVLDEDLSFQEQLDYKKAILEEAKKEQYPDADFISQIESTVSGLKKLVKQRQYRDKYFAFLQELAEGKKSAEEHLAFLQNELNSGAWGREVDDQLEEKIIEVTAGIKEQNRGIVDAQIVFYAKDKTMNSLDGAMGLVKQQLADPIVQKDAALVNAYNLQLQALEKQKLEVKIEDDVSAMVVGLVAQERANPSLWKVDNFASLFGGAGADVPVNIGGARYGSEQEYWQVTLNNYIQGDFAKEYINESKLGMTLFYNQTGFLTNAFLDTLMNKNNSLKNNPILQGFPQVVDTAIQGTIAEALGLKIRELKSKHHLDSPDLATIGDYESAIKELGGLKLIFGQSYSLSPEILAFEAGLVEKKYKLTQNILTRAPDYATEKGITLQEAIQQLGLYTEAEVPWEEYVRKPPTEIAGQLVEEGEMLPGLYEKKKGLEEQVAQAKQKVEEAQKAQAQGAAARQPVPAPTPVTVPPMAQTKQELQGKITSTQQEIEKLQSQLKATQVAGVKEKITSTQQEIEKLQSQLKTAQAAGVKPGEQVPVSVQRIELPFPTTQAQMSEYVKKKDLGEYVFDQKWYKVK